MGIKLVLMVSDCVREVTAVEGGVQGHLSLSCLTF